MAKLTAAARKAIPSSKFGLPGKRAYPIPDKSHASNAKARASQAVHQGRMTRATAEKIDAKADRVLGVTAEKNETGGVLHAKHKSGDGNHGIPQQSFGPHGHEPHHAPGKPHHGHGNIIHPHSHQYKLEHE